MPRPIRPTGRDEVRPAILAAASRRFAAEGTNASLRDIAADAGVNLGLIYRHFGNKDDLLRAVVRHHVETGGPRVAEAPDAARAVRRIFEASVRDGVFIRIMAWLLLEQSGQLQYQDQYPGMTALRSLPRAASTDDSEARLMTAMAAIYGWRVFGPQILASFEADRRDDVEQKIASLLEELVERPAQDDH